MSRISLGRLRSDANTVSRGGHKPHRISYRGTTRSRDTQVMPGHPLAGRWTSWTGMARSFRPDVRGYVARQDRKPVQTAWVDEAAGMPL